MQYPNGRASGDAFAVFSTDEDLGQALEKDKEDLMGRYVEVFRSSLKEFRVVREGGREGDVHVTVSNYIMSSCHNLRLNLILYMSR